MKHTYEYVKNFFEEQGCTLISDSYESAKQKLAYICVCGNEDVKTFNNFQQGQRCMRCAVKIRSKARRLSYEDVKKVFDKNGCILLSEEYVNCEIPLKFICKCGNPAERDFSHFKKSPRCSDCGNKSNHDKQRFSHEFVEKIFSDNGCKLLTKYKQYTQKLDYICKCGEPSDTTLANFKKGYIGCRSCWTAKIRETLYLNGTAPCSNQQRIIHGLIGGELNYPVDKLSLDIAFPDDKVYVEYDGSGHDLVLKFGAMSENDFIAKEIMRFEFLKSRGWKCVLIKSPKDYLPNEDQIIKDIVNAKKELMNNNLDEIVVDWSQKEES